MSKSISIIIPTIRHEDAEPAVQALLHQIHSPEEVIVVEDGDRDEIVKVDEINKVKIIWARVRRGGGANRARNYGIKISKGSIIAFIDSDCLPPSDWTFRVIELINKGDIDAVAGSVKGINSYNFFARFQENSLLRPVPRYKKEKVLVSDMGLTLVVTANFAVKRESITRAGFFDEKFYRYGSDDADLVQRLLRRGCKILCSPELIMYHENRNSLLKLLIRYYEYGRGFPIFRARHGKAKFSLIVSLGAFALGAAYATALTSLILGRVYDAMLALSSPLLFLCAFHLYWFIKKPKLERLLYPFVDLIIATSALVGIIIGELRERVNFLKSG